MNEPFPAAPTHSDRPRRRRDWLVGTALLAGAMSAFAGSGAAALNAIASVRGHQGASGLAYGPLTEQRFDVYVPGNSIEDADRATGSPLVIFIYGGSWRMGSRRDYGFVGQALAARGFTVMVIDYRLYPEVRYPDFLNDCALAVG